MSILERALRLGEAKQFKAYSKRVERINDWEPELELLEDDELKEQFAELRERVQAARTSTICCRSPSRSRARSAGARWRCATSTCS